MNLAGSIVASTPFYPRAVYLSNRRRLPKTYTMLVTDLLIADTLGELELVAEHHFLQTAHADRILCHFAIQSRYVHASVYREVQKRAIYPQLPPLKERFRFNDNG